jgi:hypothetical protein
MGRRETFAVRCGPRLGKIFFGSVSENPVD